MRPMTLAPSFGFLSKFKSTNGYAYPGGKSENILGLVLNEEAWMKFCKEYVEEALAPYKGDANVLGFFSDNEINFSTQGSNILDQFLKITVMMILLVKQLMLSWKKRGLIKLQQH